MNNSSRQPADEECKRARKNSDPPHQPVKRRKSRWATPDQIANTDLPATIPSNLTPQQEKIYILHLQIQELSRRINVGDLGIPINPKDRSPSPEPEYDSYGKRTNLREARARRKLEEERHNCIKEMTKLCPEYKLPMDYRTNALRFTAKVEIPQEEYPEINFLGLIIGPRGNSLKSLERETNTKIIIRGKGANKCSRDISLNCTIEEEVLHAFISAADQASVEAAESKLKEVIRTGIEDPESLVERRKNQLKELAVLNGTYRENDGLNRLKVLSEAEEIVTNRIVCGICGGVGHLESDCKQPRPETTQQTTNVDQEYIALMNELGEDAQPTNDLAALRSVPPAAIAHHIYSGIQQIPYHANYAAAAAAYQHYAHYGYAALTYPYMPIAYPSSSTNPQEPPPPNDGANQPQ